MGVIFVEFGADDAATFREMTNAVWDDWGSRSTDAQVILDSRRAFMASIGLD